MWVSQKHGIFWIDDGQQWPPHARANRLDTWLARTVLRNPYKGKGQE
jgi:hypothetical protein